ncbi:MAG: nucleoside phosphorylase [Lachnospiraceae bacterium]|nr:nucleoside phosphorylase [Lachnospiraceae bacterium]
MLQPHIQLDESHHIKYAILPGDPARVDRIAKYFDDPKELAFNREFKSIKGLYKGVPVLALSTGIGGASMTIAIEELRQIGITHLIRIGSCGALKKGIGLGDLIIVNGAVRDDGASNTYVDAVYPAVPDTDLLFGVIESAKDAGYRYHVGIARSHDSFYIDDEEEVSRFWSERGVIGSDMETAALFTVGRLRGLKTASILNNVVLWGEDTADSIGSYADGENLTAKGEEAEILTALNAFASLEERK